jgi:hypothetical protein
VEMSADVKAAWFEYIVSRLIARWHYCFLGELLLLAVDRVEFAESFPAWSKALALVIVE